MSRDKHVRVAVRFPDRVFVIAFRQPQILLSELIYFLMLVFEQRALDKLEYALLRLLYQLAESRSFV